MKDSSSILITSGLQHFPVTHSSPLPRYPRHLDLQPARNSITSQSLQSESPTALASFPSLGCSGKDNLQAQQESANRGSVPIWKRVLDILLIVLAAPLLVPLGAVIAVGIKIISRGPVFFKQERIGLLGEPFQCLKFRTMIVNADTDVHKGHLTRLMSENCPMTKLDSVDPRLIPYGRVLRVLGLDELPQVINVLRGDMSLVGPRPCVPYEYERYLPQHRGRCDTLPGLTGLWQVSGKNRTTFEEMMGLDLYYVKHKSFLLDLKIIALTIPAIVMQVCQSKIMRKLAPRTTAIEGVIGRQSAGAQ